MASSSSSPMKHQVFLSFRGEDTRLNFTTHLLQALEDKGLDVFFDEKKLERGEGLSRALSQAIAASNLSIVVLSEDYASSKSCLAELSDIMDLKDTRGHIVLPIFYHVQPSHVQNLGGSFEASFEEHKSNRPLEAKRWEAAFIKVGKFEERHRWHIEGGESGRPETEHIKDIVEYVIKKLMMKHQVYLSLGEDTLLDFSSHLLKALQDTGINVAFDVKGKQLSEALSREIAASHLSIIVLSTAYASSKRCLAELCNIMNHKSTRECIVLPIFYHVDPSDIQNPDKKFKASFENHESEGLDQVQQWKKSFAEVGTLKGWHIEGGKFDRPDIEYIRNVIEYAIKKLNSISRSAPEELVGIGQKIRILRLIEQEDSRVIGLWGPGGIGKTTLAEAVYNEISPKFDACYFLQNVREKIEKQGMESLRNEFLSKLLNEKEIRIDTPNIGSSFTQQRLKNKKVFVVLDDVDHSDQIIYMGIKHFGHGSKIILTSRDRKVHKHGGADKIFVVNKLNENESLQLFSTFAFKLLNPTAEFRDLSYEFLKYAQGSPLALKVLGSQLHKMSRTDWESEVDMLKEYPQPEISKLLKRSFHGLDDLEKNIFLDIAIFFKGEPKEDVEAILSSCYKGAVRGISNLIDKCLLDIIPTQRISMHDVLEEMGKDIVLQEPKNPGKRRRLWSPKDVVQVLKYNNGTGSIEGINLNMSQIEIDNLRVHPNFFGNMLNLRFIHFYYPQYYIKKSLNRKLLADQVDYVSFPDELKYLWWDYYPFKFLSSSFNLKNLVVLKLRNANIEQLWNEDDNQGLVSLREIDLSHCMNLRKISNLSGAIKLKILYCWGCKSLVELPCFSKLTTLERLDLSGCGNLSKIPDLLETKNLKNLICTECKSLIELPYLNHLTSLEMLELLYCENLRKIPDLSGAISLKMLNCWGCISLGELPHLNHLSISSSSSSSHQLRSQVFLSFRGQDTRLNFTGHLLRALKNNGINVFLDESILERGDHISPTLSQAIEDSNLSIIVLSKDYASSKYCLAELSDIMHCKHSQGQIVFPIFYHVNPSDVQNIGGSFKSSFEQHVSSRPVDEVKRWKTAFAEVGKLQGWHIVGGKVDRPETEYIEDIMEHVIKKLKNSESISASEELVGIDDQRKTILNAIGKTTLADGVYKEVSPEHRKIKKQGMESFRASSSSPSPQTDTWLNFIMRLLKTVFFHEQKSDELEQHPRAIASSSSSGRVKHQVFLSFRGEDTRHNFTTFLLRELKVTGMIVFFDEEKLEKGSQLSQAFSQAIADSDLSIIVLSENYASSRSCLAELSDIMHRKHTQGHIVLPVFYHVDPSQVRHIRGSFESSFEQHVSRRPVDEVKRWKTAFAEVGKLKGWHIEGGKFDRPEAEYIKDIIEYVTKKLMTSQSRSASAELVGTEFQKEMILGLIEQKDCRVVGLRGMSGIGKTTLAGAADAVHNEVSLKFEDSSFLQNANEKIERRGIECLRNELLSKLLNEKEICTEDFYLTCVTDHPFLSSKQGDPFICFGHTNHTTQARTLTAVTTGGS
ncbi:hypothetical protein V6N13_122109 [Hibiscus sabdariffa]